MQQASITYILSDIEGTTTPITFVHDVLFPYSHERLARFVKENGTNPDVTKAIADTKATIRAEDKIEINDDEAVQTLLGWIASDRKHPALKLLQGLIWDEGYSTGAYTSEVYPDVIPSIKSWIAAGKKVGIYSSGSVQAQKLLFGHTPEGDINPLLSNYFDTAVGGKKEPQSYKKITQQLALQSTQILFLSDIEAELAAANEAGMQTCQLVRAGTKASTTYPTATDFNQVTKLFFT